MRSQISKVDKMLKDLSQIYEVSSQWLHSNLMVDMATQFKALMVLLCYCWREFIFLERKPSRCEHSNGTVCVITEESSDESVFTYFAVSQQSVENLNNRNAMLWRQTFQLNTWLIPRSPLTRLKDKGKREPGTQRKERETEAPTQTDSTNRFFVRTSKSGISVHSNSCQLWDSHNFFGPIEISAS